MKKYCAKCERELDVKEFSKNKAKKDGLQSYCKGCKKEFDRQHYLKNKEYFLERNKKEREILKEWYVEYKKSLSCENCGETKWYLLQFHHKDEELKENTICAAILKCHSIKRILKEIKKCNILCSNCHIELHFLEKSGNWKFSNTDS